MGEIIPIHSRRTFSHEEALHLLPIVRRITHRAADETAALQEELRSLPQEEPHYQRLCGALETAIRRWSIKISQLGCQPRGLWLVDFDAGSGWYTWRLGDEELAFFHVNETSPETAARPEDGVFHP
jgi:hypothetical protein